MAATPTTAMVQRTLWDLRFNVRGERVTAKAIAEALEFPEEQIVPILKDLEDHRLVRRRRRKVEGQMVAAYEPWGGQE